MRMYHAILAGTSLMLSGCGAADDADVQLELRSAEPLDFIATCISQDWDGVFPRFFPADASDERKEFHTYNGTAVSISSEGDHRTIRILASTPLSKQQIAYARKCAAFPRR